MALKGRNAVCVTDDGLEDAGLERRPANAQAINGERRVKSLPERGDGLETAFNRLGRVPPAHAQFRGDDFPD